VNLIKKQLLTFSDNADVALDAAFANLRVASLKSATDSFSNTASTILKAWARRCWSNKCISDKQSVQKHKNLRAPPCPLLQRQPSQLLL
jgi:hypothetical protein